MSPNQRAIFLTVLLGSGVGVWYALTATPILPMEILTFGSLFAVWLLMRQRPSFALWHSNLRDLHTQSLLLLIMFTLFYLAFRLPFGSPLALLITLCAALYVFFVTVMGVLLILNKRYREADTFYNVMLQLFPLNGYLLAQKAYQMFEQKRYNDSLLFANCAIEFGWRAKSKSKTSASLPLKLVMAYSLRASVYITLCDGENALADTDLVVRALPQNPATYIDRGTALIFTQDFEAAEKDFNQALTMRLSTFQRAVLENNYGLLAQALNDDSAAMSHYETALSLSLAPSEQQAILPIVYANISMIDFVQDKGSAAWQAVQTGLTFDPQSGAALAMAAILHAADGTWDEAVSLWRTLSDQQTHYLDRDFAARLYAHKPRIAEYAINIIDRILPKDA